MRNPLKKLRFKPVMIAVAVSLLGVSLTCYSEEITYQKAGPQSCGVITGQPFASGNGGSKYFRIPALFTLDNGSVIAAADARYTTTEDGGGLDTMLCISHDDGESWEYSFPLFFPDSNGYDSRNATTIIDPIVAQGQDGVIYLMADVNPTGVTTYYKWPKKGTGFVDIQGTKCLAVTDVYENTEFDPAGDENALYYPYYVDAEEESGGYYAIRKRCDGTATEWAVDECYNLYELQDGIYAPLVTHFQTNNSGTMVQENLFYKASGLHVYQTGYMWLAASEDYGKTWSMQILNPQIKHEDESALLVSPGRGLVLDDGTVMFGFYNMGRGSNKADGTAHASFIYSKDGVNWERTEDIPENSLENEMVQLSENTIRMFLRTMTNNQFITYVDAVRDPAGNWVWGKVHIQEDAPGYTVCIDAPINS